MANKKGQDAIGSTVVVVVLSAAMLLIGWFIFGSIAVVTPHDQLIANETICKNNCVMGNLYTPTYTPILNDSTLVCYQNATGVGALQMTNVGNMAGICAGYNLYNGNRINLTNTSTSCSIANVTCAYTYDEANTFEQTYYNTNISNSGSAWGLLSVAVIVLAAVGIIMVILLFRNVG